MLFAIAFFFIGLLSGINSVLYFNIVDNNNVYSVFFFFSLKMYKFNIILSYLFKVYLTFFVCINFCVQNLLLLIAIFSTSEYLYHEVAKTKILFNKLMINKIIGENNYNIIQISTLLN